MEGYKQVCVWPGCTLGGASEDEFKLYMKETFDVDVIAPEEVTTNPDIDEKGNAVKDTGGRIDLFFRVADEDISKFAVPRLNAGIRWVEDAIYYNHNEYLYSKEVRDKYPKTW